MIVPYRLADIWQFRQIPKQLSMASSDSVFKNVLETKLVRRHLALPAADMPAKPQLTM
jgi:hypothetical protein